MILKNRMVNVGGVWFIGCIIGLLWYQSLESVKFYDSVKQLENIVYYTNTVEDLTFIEHLNEKALICTVSWKYPKVLVSEIGLLNYIALTCQLKEYTRGLVVSNKSLKLLHDEFKPIALVAAQSICKKLGLITQVRQINNEFINIAF